MSEQIGYLYVRMHESYEKYNVCKVGITANIPDRDSTYVTNEVIGGNFILVFEVPLKKMRGVEILLHNNFCKLREYKGGGTEFYDKQIIDLIEPFLISLKMKTGFKKLSQDEIQSLERTIRIKSMFKKINKHSMVQAIRSRLPISKPDAEQSSASQKIQQKNNYVPRNDQVACVNKAVTYFQTHNKGLIVLVCGGGKTLISLWIAQKIQSNKIVIGVPNKLLLRQWEKYVSILFSEIPCLIVSSGITISSITYFLEQHKEKCIIITTYASSHKVFNAAQEKNFAFDMKINDEAHHLTSTNINEKERKKFVDMLKIKTIKQLSLTATLKLLENNENKRDDDIIVSNDNVEYFGDVIDRKSLLWGINENIICDYVVQTIIANEEQLECQLAKFNITEENDKRLFLSAIASLKSINEGHSHHMLVYGNNKENIEKIEQYIKMLIDANYFSIPNLFFSKYHSEMKSKVQKDILDKFNKSTYGIIACVFCLGEGYDNSKIDAVVFAENMSSNIRIVQSALRSIRKNKNEPNKIAKIILPILDMDNDNDLKKVKEIIYQLGLEDETISQKIKVFKIDIERHQYKQPENYTIVNDFGEYDDELTKRLKMNTIKRGQFTITYDKAKMILANKNIRSLADYQILCENDVRLPEKPYEFYFNKFIGWIDYLGIPQIYYELDKCRDKTYEYLLAHPEISRDKLNLAKTCKELCAIDCKFPPTDFWEEYYGTTLDNAIKMPITKKIKIIL